MVAPICLLYHYLKDIRVDYLYIKSKIIAVAIAFFTVNFAHLHCSKIRGNFGLFCSFSPKLLCIHAGLHCNGNEKN